MRPTKTVLDCSTNTTSVVELTDEEIQQMALADQEWREQEAMREAEAQAKAAAKASALAKLASLGLTAEEAAALTGN
jgi:hypothetical protein